MALNPVDTHVGRRIAKIRKNRRRDPAQFAQEIGISVIELEDVERGVVRPGARLLSKIADTLGVRVDEFYEGLPNNLRDPPKRKRKKN